MAIRISELIDAGALTGDELIELSRPSSAVTKTATTISAQASDNSLNDSGAGFVTAGFAVGDSVRVQGFTGNIANNINSGRITALTAGKMTVGGTDGDVLVDDAAGESVTVTKWESVRAPASRVASSPGLLDRYVTGIGAGYALSKLLRGYIGSSIRVRRSSDNAEKDIGFEGSVLDVASLTAFVGAGNGFVTTWYDQSGAGLHLLQATAGRQPEIVSSGSVLTNIKWDGVDDQLQTAGNLASISAGFTVYFSGIPYPAAIAAGTPVIIDWAGTSEPVLTYNQAAARLSLNSGVGECSYVEAGTTATCRAWLTNLAGGTFTAQNTLRVGGVSATAGTPSNNTATVPPVGGGKIAVGNFVDGSTTTYKSNPRWRALVFYRVVHDTATMDAINAVLV